MEKITINGREYAIKSTIRAMILFEDIINRDVKKGEPRIPFKLETLLDNYLYFWCIILANNPDNPLDWDEYIDAIDEDPSLYKQMGDILAKKSDVESRINPKKDETEEDKKKD